MNLDTLPIRDKKESRAFPVSEEVLAITEVTADLARKVTRANVLLVCPVYLVSKEIWDHLVCPVWMASVDRRVTTVLADSLEAKETKETVVFPVLPVHLVLMVYLEFKVTPVFLGALVLKA